MMAPLKLIAAIVAVVSAIVLEHAAGMDVSAIAKQMDKDWLKIPRYDPEPEEVYSFAKKYLTQLREKGEPEADELLKAWDRVHHEKDLCDESSLRYIATVESCYPEYVQMLKTLDDATAEYASKCLTLDYISNKIKSQASAYSLETRFNNITEFVDDQFIADYWLEHPRERPLSFIRVNKASKAIAKAIKRDNKNSITDLEDATQVHAYLKTRFYNPCSDYKKAFEDLDLQIFYAGRYWNGSYNNLISSLEKDTQDVLFRYELCRDIDISLAPTDKSFKISQQVVSDLRSP